MLVVALIGTDVHHGLHLQPFHSVLKAVQTCTALAAAEGSGDAADLTHCVRHQG